MNTEAVMETNTNGPLVPPADAETSVVDRIVALHGPDHAGEAWITAIAAIRRRHLPCSRVSVGTIDAIVQSYDPEALDPKEEALPPGDEGRRHAEWTPFHDAQLVQNRRIVSQVMMGLPARAEWTVRHHLGFAMEHLEAHGPHHGWTNNGHVPSFSMKEIAVRQGVTQTTIYSRIEGAYRRMGKSYGAIRLTKISLRMLAVRDQMHDVERCDGRGAPVSGLARGQRTHRLPMKHAVRTAAAAFGSFPELADARKPCRIDPIPWT